MANGKKFLELVKVAVGEIQKKNANNPREKTADPAVFNLLDGKLKNIENIINQVRTNKGQAPLNIVDLIKNQVQDTQTENRNDKNVETAPGSVFDSILKKVDARDNRRAKVSIKNIVEDYNLNVSNIPSQTLRDIQASYIKDMKKINDKYAKGLNDLQNR